MGVVPMIRRRQSYSSSGGGSSVSVAMGTWGVMVLRLPRMAKELVAEGG
jgi:hypothetical protein